MRRLPLALPLTLAAALALGAGASQANASPAADEPAAEEAEPAAELATEAALVTADGTEVGVATFTAVPGGTLVAVVGTGMPPGFHGLHVHQTGLCEPDSAAPDDPGTTGDFLSAGGHIGVGESDHRHHPGDLTSLYVTEAGDAALTTVTDRFVPADLLDEDGSAVMVHSDPDNFANVPDRYAPEGPDQTTLDTGDAGSRVACGVVRS